MTWIRTVAPAHHRLIVDAAGGGIVEGGGVVDEGVEPSVDDLIGVAGDWDAPTMGPADRSGDVDVGQAAPYESEGFGPVGGRGDVKRA